MGWEGEVSDDGRIKWCRGPHFFRNDGASGRRGGVWVRDVGRRVGVRGVSDGPRVPLGVCWERRSQPGTCVDGWVPNKCEPRADDDRHVISGSRLEVPPALFIWRRLMTESTTPRPEADADASRPGDHGAHHKGRTNPIPETRGLRPHYAAEATRVRSSPIELSSAVFLVHPT